MNFGVLLLLAVVVVAVAYVLGRYVRQRERAAPRAAGAGTKLFASAANREEQAVVTWLLSQAFEQTGVKVADDKVAYQRIVEAAQKALRELKSQPAVTISLPYLTADAAGPKHFEIRLTRDVIRELVRY
jgi:Na+-transporting methylmalonyl-CoA/oxaloacetate decarboxylase gamma subunit